MKENSLLHKLVYSGKLTPKIIDSLLLKSDLLEVDENGSDTLMWALSCNNYSELNLSTPQWEQLLKKSDLKRVSAGGYNAIAFFVKYAVEQKIELTREQKTYLFENSNLKQLSRDKESLLNYLFKDKNLIKNTFTVEQLDYLVDNLPLNLTATSLSLNDREEMKKNYEEYKIEKEKRLLYSTIPAPELVFQNSKPPLKI